MKKSIYILMTLVSCTAFAQKKTYDCASISKSIIDTTLYKMVDGRLLLRGDTRVDLYEVRTPNKTVYYVTEGLMHDIESSIRTHKCEGIKIKKVGADPMRKIVRD